MAVCRLASRRLLKAQNWRGHGCVGGNMAGAASRASHQLAVVPGANNPPSLARIGRLRGGFEGKSRLYEDSQLEKALHDLQLMRNRGNSVSRDMLYRILRRCVEEKNLVIGRRVHAIIHLCGFESNTFLGNQLIRMYGVVGNLVEANQVFCKLSAPNEFVWHAIILAHTEHGQPQQAIELYLVLRVSSVKLTNYIFVTVLKACASIGDLKTGMLVHADVVESMAESNVFVGSSLIDMYSKCNRIEDARRVFDRLLTRDVVTWTVMIAGCAQHGLGREALELYREMQREGLVPDSLTFGSILKACFSVGAIEEAHKVFEEVPKRDIVSCTAMISGYAQHGLGVQALLLLEKVLQDGMTPDKVAFVSILKVCGDMGAVEKGKQIHAFILERSLEADLMVGSTLIEMYGKCGLLREARQVFDMLPKRDVACWTAMINAYGQNSDCRMAMQCFQDMRKTGMQPDAAVFTCLLAACSHAGLVDEGRLYFKVMTEKYSLTPTSEHYRCLVDLLGRSGRLEEAQNILETLPFEPNVAGWMSLLSACKTYGDISRGRLCFDHLVLLEPKLAAGYVLMSNIYSNAGMWEDVSDIERLRKSAGALKKPAKALIELENKVHEFVVGDMNCQEQDDKYAQLRQKLKTLNAQMKEQGHVPQLDLVMKPLSDAEKEDALCGHAEKLAIAFGLLNTAQGTTLRVVKNLRMCNDCHNGSKVISRMEQREIVVRDGYRVHHFKNGLCSCGDYH